MSKVFKPRRGSADQVAAFIGEANEVILNTTTNTLHVMDGLTPGGFPLAKEGDLNAFKTSQATRDANQDAAIRATLVSAVIEDGELVLTYGNGTVERESLPGGLPLGTLMPYTGKDVPAGFLRADGSTYTNMRTAFPEFYNWVVNSGLTVALGSYALVEGSCGFYGLDTSTGTVRMPTLAAGVFGTTVAGQYGQAVQAGLPNITGWLGSVMIDTASDTTSSGALKYGNEPRDRAWSGITGDEVRSVTLDASLSHPSYGRSDTVTPSHIKYPWIISLYNAAVSPSVAEAGEFVGLLDGKADVNLGNVTEEGKAAVVSWGMPNYSAGIGVVNGAAVPADGIIVCEYWYNNGVFRVAANDVWILGGGSNGAVYEVNFLAASAPVRKGDIITVSTQGSIGMRVKFYPLMGV